MQKGDKHKSLEANSRRLSILSIMLDQTDVKNFWQIAFKKIIGKRHSFTFFESHLDFFFFLKLTKNPQFLN